MADIQHLNVFIAAAIDGGQVHEKRTVIPIPPDYDAMDVRAFTVRTIEDTAFALVRDDFGREPTRAALRAHAAKVRAIQQAVDDAGVESLGALRTRLRAILDLTNDEAISLYGEEPEGH